MSLLSLEDVKELAEKIHEYGLSVRYETDAYEHAQLGTDMRFLRINRQPPIYWGIFIDPSNLPCAISGSGLPHVTCCFPKSGADRKNMSAVMSSMCLSLGDAVTITIIGISINKAGYAFVVAKDERYMSTCTSTPHITISTKSPFKPVDVGREITDENTFLLADPLHVTGIFTSLHP